MNSNTASQSQSGNSCYEVHNASRYLLVVSPIFPDVNFEINEVTESYRTNSKNCEITLTLRPESRASRKVTFKFGLNEDAGLHYQNLEGSPSSWSEEDIELLPEAKEYAKEEARNRLE